MYFQIYFPPLILSYGEMYHTHERWYKNIIQRIKIKMNTYVHADNLKK